MGDLRIRSSRAPAQSVRAPGVSPCARKPAPRPAVGVCPCGGGCSRCTSPQRAFESSAPTRLPFRRELESTFGADLSGIRAHLGRRDALRPLGAEAAARAGEVAFASATPDKGVVAHEVAHVLQYRGGTGGRAGNAEAEAESARRAARTGSSIALGARPPEPVSFFCSPETPQDCFDETTQRVLEAMGIDASGLTFEQAQLLAGMLGRLAQVTTLIAGGETATELPGETIVPGSEPPCTRTLTYRLVTDDGELMVEYRDDASGRTDGFSHMHFRHVSGLDLERTLPMPATSETGTCYITPVEPTAEDRARIDAESERRLRVSRETFRAPSGELLTEALEINALDAFDEALAAIPVAEEAKRHAAAEDLFGNAPQRFQDAIDAAELHADELAQAAGYDDRGAALDARDEFVEHFRDFAVRVANTMLWRSYNIALDEGQRYSDPGSAAEVAELFEAMGPLRNTVDQIDQYNAHFTMALIAPLGMRVDDVGDARPALRRRAGGQLWDLQRDFAGRFPVIAPALSGRRVDDESPFYDLARIDSARALHRRLRHDAYEVADDVVTARRSLRDDPDLVWSLENVIARAKELAAIAPGSIADRLIDEAVAQEQREDTAIGLLLAVLAIALGAISGGTGTVAVAATVASAGLSGYMLMQSWRTYDTMSSASGTAIGDEAALTANAPWIGWLILDIVGLGLDLGAVGMLFRSSSRFTASALRAVHTTGEEGEAAMRALREEAEVVARENPAVLGSVTPETFVDSVVDAARREQDHLAEIAPAVRAAVADSLPVSVRESSQAVEGLARLPDDVRARLLVLLADDPDSLQRLGELSAASESFRDALAATDLRNAVNAATAPPPVAAGEVVDEAAAAVADLAHTPPPTSTAADLLDPAFRASLGARAGEVASSIESAVGPEGLRAIQDALEPATLTRASQILTPDQLMELVGRLSRRQYAQLFARDLGGFVRDMLETVGGTGLQRIVTQLDIHGVVRLTRDLHPDDIVMILRNVPPTASADAVQQLLDLVGTGAARSEILGIALHRADPTTLESIFQRVPVADIAARLVPPRGESAFYDLTRELTAAEGEAVNAAWRAALASGTPPASMIGGPVSRAAIRVQILTGLRQAIPRPLQRAIELVRTATAVEATNLRALCNAVLSRPAGVTVEAAVDAHLAANAANFSRPLTFATLPRHAQNLLRMTPSRRTYRTVFGSALEQLTQMRLLDSNWPQHWFQVVRADGRPDILIEMTSEWGDNMAGRFAVLDWTSYAAAGHIAERYRGVSVDLGDRVVSVVEELIDFKVELLHPGPRG